MAVVFKNNATTTLNGSITNVATSITVTSGAVFPTVTARSAITSPTAGSASYADTTKGVWSLDNSLANDIAGGTALSSAGSHSYTTAKFGTYGMGSTADYSFTPALYASSTDYAVGDGDFTFDFWFYKYSGGYGGGAILNIYTASNNYLTLVAFPSSAGTVYSSRSGSTSTVATTGNFPAVNAYGHIALERMGGYIYVYSGGTRILNAGVLANNPTFSGSTTVVFGGQNGNGSGAYSSYGILDECRFCTTAKYGGSATITVPSAAYTDDGLYLSPVQYSSTNATDAGDYFYATITDGTNTEIVKVTNVSTNTLTVVRAQDGTGTVADTTGYAFASGSTIQIRPTNRGLIDLRNDQLFREVAYTNKQYLGAK